MSNDAVDFTKLTGRQLEELCYDLLLKYGFDSLKWRQGGGDRGLDIEAQRTFNDHFVDPYSETWFVECKNQQGGLGVEDISEKFAWQGLNVPIICC